MRAHETAIVGIAELIAAKEKMIERMRTDQALIKNTDIRGVVLKIDTDLDSTYLFEDLKESSELVNEALERKLAWIIDHVYDHAIQMAESKIEANIEQLKLDLNKQIEKE